MLTEYEVEKLRHTMRKELNAGPDSVLACLIGLVLVVILAAIGSLTSAGRADTAVTAAPTHSAAQQ